MSAGDGQQQSGAVGGDQANGLTSQLSGTTQLATSHATLVRNSGFLIRAGAVIPCLPIDAQNSSMPGFTSCRVPEWFRSSDQRRGLIPPGTRIFGQIKSGISNGRRRLGVVYTLIETRLFNMKLAAPAADAMGRAGLDGDIHTFFWDKAGAVALYALMDVAIGSGQNLASSALSRAYGNYGGQTLNFGSQGETGHLADIIRPRVSVDLDYEGELAVIIGAAGRQVSTADALKHVAGYACYNDASVRDFQHHTSQFTPGKNFPATGAFGPWMVTPDELGELGPLLLQTRLNGEVVQEARLRDMIFDVSTVIAYCSTFTRLEPGDVIASGTPGGVGAKREPPLWMKPGDIVEVEIEKLGLLRNGIGDEHSI